MPSLILAKLDGNKMFPDFILLLCAVLLYLKSFLMMFIMFTKNISYAPGEGTG